MPTSAAGNRPNRPRWRRSVLSCRGTGGFTLIELLVVLAIVALATAGVGLALRDTGQASLDREAERLAALLESARAQSRTSGIAVRWRITPDGPGNFVFDGLPPGSLPTAWLSDGISARPLNAEGAATPALQLGPDPIIAPQQVLLTAQGPPAATLRIGTDGLRPFAVIGP
ncbi:MAG: prepilin-type N-terminal cleavage/methylation domain-containing protein [Gammaproteobacteria bacterium]|nr:prepilin-type N-terminal cleavage/methylation domain-containing protein [Gammaproteobacteria bacterium]MBU1442343.1 prepilin-type N-terminal cleavage/methylation domain-containing protein [Gammaproteobacteria bacterium]MBU2286478.1 prepilin-type N-terminal cleavage/methylation domain-containing protein [Gammaproteobacteria bacterium]MBU2410082.1 prepilin-type N-terminal cleavage/methylation domain-containing protein [Gammaproteobacteria bacterium]